MIEKRAVTLECLKETIRDFYDMTKYHFLTLNGVAMDEYTVQIQWIFSKYGTKDEVVVFFADVNIENTIPSIVDIIPSAIISQREIVDMFGMSVEDSAKGLYLDEDSLQSPLSMGCAI